MAFSHLLLMLVGASVSTIADSNVLETIPILNVSQSAWKSLNNSISGRLHLGSPLGRPCYDVYHNSFGEYFNQSNNSDCEAAQNKLTHSEQLIQDFGSYHNPAFGSCMATGERCAVSPTKNTGVSNGTCYQGSIPDYYVEADGIEDIQYSLRFAKKYKVPVTIKNTGHDYKGRSTAPNTLAIWYVYTFSLVNSFSSVKRTHKIVPAPEVKESFIADGCDSSAGPVVTYGAGQTFDTLYDFLHGKGYMVCYPEHS